MRGACITWVCLVGLEGWSLVTLKVVWVCMFVHVCECVCMCVHVGWGRRERVRERERERQERFILRNWPT